MKSSFTFSLLLKLIIFELFILLNVHSQCSFSPDVSHYPVTPWTNAYLYFPNDTIGHFLKARYISEQSLTPNSLDSFYIEWKMKVVSGKSMYVFGKFYNCGWFISVDSIYNNLRYVAFHSIDLQNHYYVDTIAYLNFSDTAWHTYKMRYVRANSSAAFYGYKDNLLTCANQNCTSNWNEGNTLYSFCVGFRYNIATYSQPSQIQALRNGYSGFAKYLFFTGYLDYIKIHRYDNTLSNIHDFNWQMTEGSGQFIHDSLTYRTHMITYPDNAYSGSHLILGESPSPDTSDPVWFREGNYNSIISNMGNGLQCWKGLGNSDDYWVPGFVLGISSWNNNIIAMGHFNRANVNGFGSDNGTHTNFIAMWNGSQWLDMGNGFNNDAEKAITYSDGGLIVTGLFTRAGNIYAGHIAEWKNNQWSSLGSGLDSGGLALTYYNDHRSACQNELYVGGIFKKAGGINAKGVAKWNGSNWSRVGTSGISGGTYVAVWCFAVYKDKLYIGGEFDYADGKVCNSIARLDCDGWNPVHHGVKRIDGTRGIIWTMAVYNDTLWVGGCFKTANGIEVNNIAKFDGHKWHNAGAGTSMGFDESEDAVDNMCVTCGKLYISGPFFYMDNKPVNKFCVYDGKKYCALNYGFDGRPLDMFSTSDHLYMSGLVTWCDGYEVNSILSYPLSNCNTGDMISKDKKTELSQNYPNPFNPTTMIKYSVGFRNLVTIKIYDVVGKEIITLVNEVKEPGVYSTEFDGTNLASGTYFYKISIGDAVNVKKMVLIK